MIRPVVGNDRLEELAAAVEEVDLEEHERHEAGVCHLYRYPCSWCTAEELGVIGA